MPSEIISSIPDGFPAAAIEFKYDGLSRLIERKVTLNVDPQSKVLAHGNGKNEQG